MATGAQAISVTRRRALTPAARDTLLVLVGTRLLVWITAVVAAAAGGSGAGARFDDTALTHPFGAAGNALFSPLARWDAVWYLRVAAHGYESVPSRGFFPLYPDSVRALAFGSDSRAALLVSAYLVSLLAFAGALYLLHRLVTLELGARYARPALLLLALFPGAVWFGAPFSESLFLLLAVGAFYAARLERWAWAGVAAGLASAVRSPGVLLAIPLLVLWWQAQPRRTRDLGWIALSAAGLVAFSAYLGIAHGDALAWQHVESRYWFHHFAPLGGLVDGTRAAFDGVRQLVAGSSAHVYWTAAGGDPIAAAWHNVQDWLFLAVALVAAAGAVRRLPAAYGAYVVVSLVMLLSVPVTPEPLMSIVRYVAVVFPLFMWLATLRRRTPILAAFTLLLLFETVRFATWHWVA